MPWSTRCAGSPGSPYPPAPGRPSPTLPAPAAVVAGRLTNEAKLALLRSPYPNAAALLDDCVDTAVDALMAEQGGPPWTPEGYATLLARVRSGLTATTLAILDTVRQVLAVAADVEPLLDG